MVERANLGPDDASIMRCAVAQRCILMGYHKTSDGMVHIDMVELGILGNDASFRGVHGQTCYRGTQLSKCLGLPEFAPYFEVVQVKGNPWVSLQFCTLVPSPSSTDQALLATLSSVGNALVSGSFQSHLDRLPAPQPVATASASSSASVQRPAPAELRTCGADSILGTHPPCQVHTSLSAAFSHVDASCCSYAIASSCLLAFAWLSSACMVQMQSVPSGVKAKAPAGMAAFQYASTAEQPARGILGVDAAEAVASAVASMFYDQEVQVRKVAPIWPACVKPGTHLLQFS